MTIEYLITKKDHAMDVVIQPAHTWSKYPTLRKVKVGDAITYAVEESAITAPGITDRCQLVPVAYFKKQGFKVETLT